MTATRRATANDIMNETAVELWGETAVDPYSSTDKNFVQLRYMINTAGEELSDLYDWEFLTKEYSFTTAALDDGDYDLPTDYLKMINQTHWERTNQNPMSGPLSPQEWQYLTAADTTSPIYVSFRLSEGLFRLFPQPPEAGLEVAFEYLSRKWVIDATDGTTLIDSVTEGADTPLFDKTLMRCMLKVKWLSAKNFDTTKAQADLNQCFAQLTGRDKGARILNITGRGRRVFMGDANIPVSGLGS